MKEVRPSHPLGPVWLFCLAVVTLQLCFGPEAMALTLSSITEKSTSLKHHRAKSSAMNTTLPVAYGDDRFQVPAMSRWSFQASVDSDGEPETVFLRSLRLPSSTSTSTPQPEVNATTAVVLTVVSTISHGAVIAVNLSDGKNVWRTNPPLSSRPISAFVPRPAQATSTSAANFLLVATWGGLQLQALNASGSTECWNIKPVNYTKGDYSTAFGNVPAWVETTTTLDDAGVQAYLTTSSGGLQTLFVPSTAMTPSTGTDKHSSAADPCAAMSPFNATTVPTPLLQLAAGDAWKRFLEPVVTKAGVVFLSEQRIVVAKGGAVVINMPAANFYSESFRPLVVTALDDRFLLFGAVNGSNPCVVVDTDLGGISPTQPFVTTANLSDSNTTTSIDVVPTSGSEGASSPTAYTVMVRSGTTLFVYDVQRSTKSGGSLRVELLFQTSLLIANVQNAAKIVQPTPTLVRLSAKAPTMTLYLLVAGGTQQQFTHEWNEVYYLVAVQWGSKSSGTNVKNGAPTVRMSRHPASGVGKPRAILEDSAADDTISLVFGPRSVGWATSAAHLADAHSLEFLTYFYAGVSRQGPVYYAYDTTLVPHGWSGHAPLILAGQNGYMQAIDLHSGLTPVLKPTASNPRGILTVTGLDSSTTSVIVSPCGRYAYTIGTYLVAIDLTAGGDVLWRAFLGGSASDATLASVAHWGPRHLVALSNTNATVFNRSSGEMVAVIPLPSVGIMIFGECASENHNKPAARLPIYATAYDADSDSYNLVALGMLIADEEFTTFRRTSMLPITGPYGHGYRYESVHGSHWGLVVRTHDELLLVFHHNHTSETLVPAWNATQSWGVTLREKYIVNIPYCGVERLDWRTGKQVWNSSAALGFDGWCPQRPDFVYTPFFSDVAPGFVFAMSQTHLYRFDTESGSVSWNVSLQHHQRGQPVGVSRIGVNSERLQKEPLVFADFWDFGTKVLAVNGSDGELLWPATPLDPGCTNNDPTNIQRGGIVIGMCMSTTTVFNALEGKRLGSISGTPGGWSVASPVIVPSPSGGRGKQIVLLTQSAFAELNNDLVGYLVGVPLPDLLDD